MTHKEELLLLILKQLPSHWRAVMLQSFIAEEGPLSEEAGTEVRKILQAPARL
jgi:hypothetical protein